MKKHIKLTLENFRIWWGKHCVAFILGWFLNDIWTDGKLVDADPVILGYIPWALGATFLIWSVSWLIFIERPSRACKKNDRTVATDSSKSTRPCTKCHGGRVLNYCGTEFADIFPGSGPCYVCGGLGVVPTHFTGMEPRLDFLRKDKDPTK